MRKTKLLFFITALGISFSSFAQVKIGDNPTTINPGSVLELESTNKGLLMPRVSLTNTTTWGLLGTPAAGMHVYNTNTAILAGSGAYPVLSGKIGQYYWDGKGWVALAPIRTVFVSATGNLQQIAEGNQFLLFQNEIIDRAGNFNPVTSIFTVPSDGVYAINTYVRVSGDPMYPRGRIGMNVSASVFNGTTKPISSGIAFVNDWGFSSGSIMMQLTAGQQVRILFNVVAVDLAPNRMLDIKNLEIAKISD